MGQTASKTESSDLPCMVYSERSKGCPQELPPMESLKQTCEILKIFMGATFTVFINLNVHIKQRNSVEEKE